MNLNSYDAFTLYEVFFETGTEAGGTLFAAAENQRQRGNLDEYRQLKSEHMQLCKDRYLTNPTDRNQQIHYAASWSKRINALHDSILINSDINPLQTWNEWIRPSVFNIGEPSDNPVTVFLGGQPAAGKTSGQKLALSLHPGLVPIIGDDYRQYHRNYLQLLDNDSQRMPSVTAKQSGEWTGMCVDYADQNRYSTLIEGTWRNAATVLNEAETAKKLGRNTHAVIVATNPTLSRMGMLARYYGNLAQGTYARWTPIAAHETVVENISQNIQLIVRSELIDRFTVTDRTGTLLFDSEDNNRSNGIGVWMEKFSGELTPYESDQLMREARLVGSYVRTHPEETARIEDVVSTIGDNDPMFRSIVERVIL